ncbi:UDP-N-acetylmuramoyl-L-alanyl-D-glutamate--2,6-diaminopimelate ligase [Salinibacillus xinjiangensis]|uniref:UDP-N-acetylmuramoyl-L-alanyl-D-glutamate--2,6-diaminopimelate ligase n=1 Tax=Salinibacillus xinjiangensis TaxID=1229268 RepID=A0A6G1X3L6_9BACI|nr:UDP-N-acetylmuramoyl-L-alanyl-D-glutamate--2,6-diaminopimelate ligase [Salinibacillus xinjiangensis]MRG85496.1 UDP-N-acetylmuramoyl-L-alanyl-D-glutamate--2,6-diaminopimelate ligase [Salinibacillus xinjiangensis]
MKLTQLLKTIKFYHSEKKIDDIDVTGIEMDSRQVDNGNVFVCIDGFTVDGHQFAKMAEQKGACAIIAERPLSLDIPVIIVNDTAKALAQISNTFYENPSEKFQLIGITGTNGKTTLTYMLDEIFQLDGQKTGLIGTIQMKIINDTYSVKNTTPDSLFLQKSFHKMVNKDVDTVMMEVSSHALDLGRVYGTDYDIAVFTNLTQDHLDYHKNMEDYFRAKSLLFAQMGNRYDQPKFAVINIDDPYGKRLVRSTAYEVLTYGIENQANVMAKNLSLNPNGTVFDLSTPVGEVHIESSLVGEFSVYNMLAASSAALCANVPLKTIQSAFSETKGVPGRFENVNCGQEFGVIVDYAHTPDSLENVLKTVQSLAKGKTYVVVGCGGDRDKGKRPKMANVAITHSDKAIFTSDNPRTEDPDQILQDMVEGLEATNFSVERDRKQAISQAIQQCQPGDVVVIAGKGHETYQEIGKERFDFDDCKVASEMIEKKLKGRS